MADRVPEEELKAIRERAEKATEGPWFWRQAYELYDGFHWALHSPESEANNRVIGLKTVAFDHFSTEAEWQADPDVQFIAHARTDIPTLLAELTRVTEERDALRDGGWVRVEERLPESQRMVLLAAPTSYAGSGGVIYGWCDSGKWMYRNAIGVAEVSGTTCNGSDPVTHWRPLPAPPVEEK